ncbi:MAG: thioredoxin [Bacteroidaceae bacterium]|nr:thioredoxin [Bacteroidaceae bacterium]
MKSFKEQINSPRPVLVDFYAEWCGPCKMMKPILLDVAERIGDNASIIAIDVDKEEELANRFRIQSVPTLIIFKNGKQLWRHSGVITSNTLTQLLKEYE